MKRKPVTGASAAVASAIYAVIYARVSSKEQEKEGYSIPAQLELLRQHAQKLGIVVLREFIDVETAKQSGRTHFTEMITFLAENRNKCRVVLVEKTDRLYRNLKDWVTVEDADIIVHFVKEGNVITPKSDSNHKFMHGIKVLMAKNYIDNLSEETSKGMREKAREGMWPSRAPLGYRNIAGVNGKRQIEPDPISAPIIRRVFERYASGQYSLKQIAQFTREQGLTFRKSGSPVNKSTVHTILHNRLYTGEFDWDGQTYSGRFEPIVTPELWERVQAILEGRFANRHRKVKHDFAFSGLITCGHCGCSLVGEIKKRRYIYYHCTGYKGKCNEPYTREEALDAKFAEVLGRLYFDEDVLQWVTSALRSSHDDERLMHEEAMKRLQQQYNQLQNRLDAMYVDKLDGRVGADFFERKSCEWRAEQDRVMRALQQHQTANCNYMDAGVQLLELAQRAGKLFQKQSPDEKRRLLAVVLSNCTWKDGELTVKFRQPFDLIALASTQAKKPVASVGAENALNKEWLLR